jgi:hypothetical protein
MKQLFRAEFHSETDRDSIELSNKNYKQGKYCTGLVIL